MTDQSNFAILINKVLARTYKTYFIQKLTRFTNCETRLRGSHRGAAEDSDLQQYSILLFDRHILTFQTDIVPSSLLLPLPLLLPHTQRSFTVHWPQLLHQDPTQCEDHSHTSWLATCSVLSHNYVTHPIFPHGYIPGTARPCRRMYYNPSKCWTILDQ
jgi:hypothetical protein